MTTVIHIKDAPKGWETDDQYVYIGRAGNGHNGYFGNPIRLQPGESRGTTILRFALYAEERRIIDKTYAAAIQQLQGKTLVCFCKPAACHGDILAELADR